MKVIRGCYNLTSNEKGCVVTIGNFDGIHLGHQKLIAELTAKAKELNTKSMVITFEPQPYEYFHPLNCPARLMRFREKARALMELKVDYLLVLPFNREFAQLSAIDFITHILVQKLAIRHILVGDDFRFGMHRKGDFNLLAEYGKLYGFSTAAMSTCLIENERVSSTRLRMALENDQLDLAEKLLGRPYGMSGRVAHGNKLGRELGFPTANIHLHRRVVPIHGIYVVQTYGLGEAPIDGVANVGNRPAIGGTRTLLEVYLFDFNQDIYGQHIYVTFLHKLRNEEHYESLELLREQIAKDVENAKSYFAKKMETF